MHKILLAAALLLLTSEFALPLAAAPSSYTVTDLGETNGPFSDSELAVNDRGQVIGALRGKGACLWENGKAVSVGTLPPESAEDGTRSEVYALNNRGQVVGSSGSFSAIFGTGLASARGFIFENGIMRQLTREGASFQPYAINDAGQITGRDAYTGFFYQRGKLTDIKTLSHVPVGNRSTAHALNTGGVVVGWSTVGKSKVISSWPLPFHAFVWKPKTHKFRDLGTLPHRRDSYAYGINDKGQIVGMAEESSIHSFNEGGGSVTEHGATGVLWFGNKAAALPPLSGDTGSAAWAINNAGVIVGQSLSAGGTVRACLWRKGKPVDLNTLLPDGSGWTLTDANALNNMGWIVGSGTLGGKPHAFLLTPH